MSVFVDTWAFLATGIRKINTLVLMLILMELKNGYHNFTGIGIGVAIMKQLVDGTFTFLLPIETKKEEES